MLLTRLLATNLQIGNAPVFETPVSRQASNAKLEFREQLCSQS